MTIDRYHGQLQTNHDPSGNRGNHVITGFNPVVDAAALSAFGASQLPADRNRVIEQTAGDAATEASGRGLYYADGLGGWKRLDPEHARSLAAAASAGVSALESAQYPGFSFAQEHTGPAAVLLTNGNSVDVDGPAAGFVRVITGIHVYAASTTNTAVSWQMYTGATPGLQLKRDVALAITQGFSTSSTTFAGGLLVLGSGESLRVSNTGVNPNTGDLVLRYRYYDLPVGTFTAVRVQLSGATPVVVVPAAATGFKNRIARFGGFTPLANVAAVMPVWVARNDDTSAAQLEVFEGAALIGRSVTASANTDFLSIPGMNDTEITDQPLAMALRAGVAARPVSVALVYETLPVS